MFHPASGEPVFNASSIFTTATSISLSWIIPEGSIVASYEVKWASDQCSDHGVMDSATTTTSSPTNYTILDLRPGTNYTISVTATNSAGNISSETATVETEEEGELIVKIIITHCLILANKCI